VEEEEGHVPMDIGIVGWIVDVLLLEMWSAGTTVRIDLSNSSILSSYSIKTVSLGCSSKASR